MNADAHKLTQDKMESINEEFKNSSKDNDYLKDSSKLDFNRKMKN